MKRRKALFLAALLALAMGCNNRSWSSGDRVLVSKFAYDSGLGQPSQFDVVVFKYPKGPVENGIPKNYIKRLMGLSGQIIAIFFGNLFSWEPGPGEAAPFDDDKNPQIDPHNLWKDQFMHVDESLPFFEQSGKFQIVRKPPEVMMAMRRIVFDNDYPALDLVGKLPPRWNPTPKSGWSAGDGNSFSNTGEDKAVGWLRYKHRLRPWAGEPLIPAERKEELITDFMDYNGGVKFGLDPDYKGENWVSDLMVECQLTVEKAEGEFWMELSRGIYRFRARFDLGTGQCTLFKVHGDKVTEMDTQPTRVKGPGTYDVRFANFDCRLTVWVNRDLPFGDGKDYPPPEIRGKDEKDLSEKLLLNRSGPTDNDLEPASIGSMGAAVKIQHVRLWRDSYYTVNNNMSDTGMALNSQIWSNPADWDVLRKLKAKTMYVQPDHFLCLGDNSPQSSDSRDWGLVPRRLLLGRALVVYFPLNRVGPIR